MREPASVSRLLAAWGAGEKGALDRLTPRVYGELYKVARAYLRRRRPDQSFPPTALINETFLRLLDQPVPVQWEGRAQFFGRAARLMRFILVDRARTRKAAKRGGGTANLALDDWMAAAPERNPSLLGIDEALNQLAAVDERKARVIELRYFGGLDREEVAATLGLSLATTKRDQRLGEAWLRRFLAHPGVECRRP